MFSELVDDIVSASGRPDMREDVIDYANTIIRKIHAKALWDRNFKSIAVGNPNPREGYLRWTRSNDVQVIRTIHIPEKDVYLTYQRVGRHLKRQRDYYYAEGNDIIMVSDGICNATIGYYRRPTRFKYYTPDQRPAVFDCVTEKWTYLVPHSQGDYTHELFRDEDQFFARRAVADWIIHEYPDAIKAGVLNYIYSQVGDDQARSQYAIFKDAIADIIRVEAFASVDA